MELLIYTDGGCSGNPGPGGWAYVIIEENGSKGFSGGEKGTTNNRMELTAVIKAFESILKNEKYSKARIHLNTDSQYVKNGITKWINNWIKNGWKTAAKQPVKNQDLWKILKELSDQLEIQWHWVKGHSGNKYNEECDSMVKKEMIKLK